MDETSADILGFSQSGVSQGSGVGVQGHSPLFTGGGSMTNGINAVWGWLNQPLAGQMSPVELSLLVGIVLISIILWNFVLYHIRIAAESI